MAPLTVNVQVEAVAPPAPLVVEDDAAVEPALVEPAPSIALPPQAGSAAARAKAINVERSRISGWRDCGMVRMSREHQRGAGPVHIKSY